MQKIKLRVNEFFYSAAIASYLLGVVIARHSGLRINLINLAAGVLIFSAFYLLQLLQRFMTSNRINPFTRVRSGAQNQSTTIQILIIGAFFGIFGGLFLLLRTKVLIGTNFLLIAALGVVMFLSMGRFTRLWFNTMTWLFEGWVVSPLMLLLGSAIQEYQFSRLYLLLWMPSFFLYSASAITLLFAEYDKNSDTRKQNFIGSVGWEKALTIHHGLLIMTYLSLLVYIAVSNTWSSNWQALLLTVFAGLEVLLLEQMARGMKPNWQLIKTLAIIQFFSLIYLLAYPLLIK